jgi:hypothetical protein
MATPHRIQVQPADTGILNFNQDEAAASKVSELLQQDLEVPYSSLMMVTRVPFVADNYT